MFIMIEGETGAANVIVWKKVFEAYWRVVLGASMIGVRGQVQREGEVVHIIAHYLADLSADLVSVGARDGRLSLPYGGDDEFHRGSTAAEPRGLPKERDLVVYSDREEIRVKTRDFR